MLQNLWSQGETVESEVPYMPSVTNLSKILDAIQRAGAPDAFGLDFLKDLGFTSSNDRAAIKLLKFLGFLETSGKPTAAYKEFMDQNRAKAVLAVRLRKAYDDLFLSDKEAQSQSVGKPKAWPLMQISAKLVPPWSPPGLPQLHRMEPRHWETSWYPRETRRRGPFHLVLVLYIE
jgi:hypothetical protein